MSLNTALKNYYIKEVEIKRERTKRAVEATIPVVEKIVAQINKSEPRFDRNIYRVGSHYQGLKVKKPNEFDFSVPVLGAGPLFWGGDPSRTRNFKFNPDIKDDIDTFPDDVTVVRSSTALPEPPTGYMVVRVSNSETNGGKKPDEFSSSFPGIGSGPSSLRPTAKTDAYGGKKPYEFSSSAPNNGNGPSSWRPAPNSGANDGKKPDEFASSVPDSGSGPSSWRLPPNSDANDGKMTAFGYYIPFYVKRHLKKLLQDAIRILYPDQDGQTPRLARKSNGPALTIRIPYIDPEDPSMTEISVDLSPILPIQLPYADHLGWPRAGTKWPSKEKIEAIKKIGINAKPKKAMDWLRCYARGDQELMRGMDQDGGCRKKCLRILKRIREQHWCLTTKPAITSYTLKTVLWWECEELWQSSDWHPERLSDRVLGLIRRLLRYIDNDCLPHYFEPAYNLLGSTDPIKRNNLKLERERMIKFMEDPIKMLT